MGSSPTKRNLIGVNSYIRKFNEFTTPANELIRLLTVTQLKINAIKENPNNNNYTSLKRMGFNCVDIENLGIKL